MLVYYRGKMKRKYIFSKSLILATIFSIAIPMQVLNENKARTEIYTTINLNSKNVNFNYNNIFNENFSNNFGLGLNRNATGDGYKWCNFYIGIFKNHSWYSIRAYENFSSSYTRSLTNSSELDGNFFQNYSSSNDLNDQKGSSFFINEYSEEGEIQDTIKTTSMMEFKNASGQYTYGGTLPNNNVDSVNGTDTIGFEYANMELEEGKSYSVGLKISGLENKELLSKIFWNTTDIKNGFANRWTVYSDDYNIFNATGLSVGEKNSSIESTVLTYSFVDGNVNVYSGTTDLNATTGTLEVNEDKKNITASEYLLSKNKSEFEKALSIQMNNGYYGSSSTNTFSLRSDDSNGVIYLDYSPKSVLKNGGVSKNSSKISIIVADNFKKAVNNNLNQDATLFWIIIGTSVASFIVIVIIIILIRKSIDKKNRDKNIPDNRAVGMLETRSSNNRLTNHSPNGLNSKSQINNNRIYNSNNKKIKKQNKNNRTTFHNSKTNRNR